MPAKAALVKDELVEQIVVGKEHILLIDYEQIYLEMGKTMLERLGFRASGEAARRDQNHF